MRRDVLLVGIGGLVGAVLGAVVVLGALSLYTFITRTIPETQNNVQVFNELNDLRQQLNEVNEERKAKEKERTALRPEPTPTPAPMPESVPNLGGLEALLPPRPAPAAEPAARPNDPFAEIDAEIQRLEETQKILNTILDKFSRSKKEKKEP